ncbi:PREDICTED: uncharacterized phosphotransferase YvkC-like isoform X2 [Priapulus caudatus]|uniref:Uncharacterized phosphotransferase YvkC-like isoform X2 n=1 Tax=Priapulus caudatus TaxID=37621 RepID=A0ABM1DW86_PRICU|nr:PREDICTED: uncharacterized phosphotransferase YvkC-like isoform X2 [Priapulus caudatus]
MLKLEDGRYFHFPGFPDTTVYNTDGQTFTAGGLKFEVLEPLSKCRLTFNGRLSEEHQRYEVCGQLFGKLTVAREPERTLLLRGVRQHSWGIRDWTTYNRYMSHCGYLEDGTFFSFSAASIPSFLSHIVSGYVILPCGQTRTLKSTDLHLSLHGEITPPSDKLCFNAVTGHLQCAFSVEKKQDQIVYSGERWSVKIHKQFTDVTMNGVRGWGFTEYMYRHNGLCPVRLQKSVPLLKEPAIDINRPCDLTLEFTKPACASSQLVGGKGTQLALLTQLDGKFIVPRGFCLTVAAYRHHLKDNKHLRAAVKELENVAYKRKEGDIHEMSKAIVESFNKTQLTPELERAVLKQLSELFGDEWSKKTFAVRSSAVGEDGGEASFAGQMETFLGVIGIKEICNAIVKCWASSFTQQAVAYKRNHGQIVAADVGVCIQEMVEADAAGVLFTRDPVTGNPGIMTINVSYGIGEAVVSGVTEPDTIYLQRGFNDKLIVKEKILGSKKIKMVISESGGLVEMESDGKTGCCLPDDISLELGNIGIQVEKSFSDARDIEFAVKEGRIYLLQARPITSLDIESEFELIHEDDGPLLIDSEMFTNANTGEMMPQAMTPLTCDAFISTFAGLGQILKVGIMGSEATPNTYADVGGCSFCKHFVINMFSGLYYINEYTTLIGTQSQKEEFEIMLFGKPLGNEHMDIVDKRFRNIRVSLYHKIMGFLNMNISALRVKHYIQQGKTVVKTANTDFSTTDTRMLYQQLDKLIQASSEAWYCHMQASMASSMASGIIKRILDTGRREDHAMVMSEVASLLSTCPDVLSADVPHALRKIALTVIDSGKAEFFQSLSAKEAAQWLQTDDSGELKNEFAKFIETHGHRCVRESELWEKPWRMQPEKVVKTIQKNVAIHLANCKNSGRSERKW